MNFISLIVSFGTFSLFFDTCFLYRLYRFEALSTKNNNINNKKQEIKSVELFFFFIWLNKSHKIQFYVL
jgi:hypothetical protein